MPPKPDEQTAEDMTDPPKLAAELRNLAAMLRGYEWHPRLHTLAEISADAPEALHAENERLKAGIDEIRFAAVADQSFDVAAMCVRLKNGEVLKIARGE